jgi:hypothetical protein
MPIAHVPPDGGAVARFATRWWTPIFRFSLNMLGNASQAAAVTEETMFVLLQPDRPSALPLRVIIYELALQFSLLRRRWTPQPVECGPAMRQALQRLSNADRAALLLRDVELLPVEEIARVLRTSPDDVRARAHRGRLHLMDDPARALLRSCS